MSAAVARTLLAGVSLFVLIGITACGAGSGARSVAESMEQTRVLDERAEMLCSSWAAYDPDNPHNYRLLSARDTDLSDLRSSLAAAGVAYGSDNILAGDRQGYAALCLLQPPDAPEGRLLGYIIDDHENGFLGTWNR